jgi:hypothetical protein
MEAPQKLKIEWLYDPAIPLLGVYTKECKSVTIKIPAHPCLFQHYSLLLWNQLSCPTTNEELRKCGIYIQWNFIQS